MQANSRRNRTQWNYHTHPIVELPLVQWGCAAVPRSFSFFHAFAASSSVFCIAKILFKTLKQLLKPNSGTNIKNTLYRTLSQWNYHAGTAPGHVELYRTTLAFYSFSCSCCSYNCILIYVFAIVFRTF